MVFGLGLRVAPQTRSEGSSSICFPLCKSKPPILEPKGGGCFGGLSKQRPCLTQECRLGPNNQKTKAPRKMLEQFWCFAFLALWFYCGQGYISKNQRTKKKTKSQKTNKPKLFQHSPWSFGFLVSVVGWFFTDTFGGLKLDTPEKARKRRWERCFEGRRSVMGAG